VTQRALENLVKQASDKMRSDDNTKGTAKYLEHFSWLLFLRVYELVEDEAEMVAQIDGRAYHRCIDGKCRWSAWTKAGLTGDPLIEFVTNELFPHLRSLSGTRRANKVAELFSAVTTVMKSGYVLAEVIAIVDKVEFQTADDYHAISVIYERLLAEMGGDASWSGEFYTPRPVVELMVKVTAPTLKESIYDPCSGSCGFLVSAYGLLAPNAKSGMQRNKLQDATLHGKEAGELPFLLGTMNMMLHGVEVPDNIRANTLEEDIRAIGPDKQYDVVLTNPPFGGKENPQVQQNFIIKTAATEVLFLQHILASLKASGRCAVVAPDGILFDADDAFCSLRRKLLSDCNLHTIVRLPIGAFPNTPHQRLNLLFFDRTGPTAGIWYYEQLVPENRRHLKHPRYNKTNPLRFDEFEPLIEWWTDRGANENAWFVPIEDVDEASKDLDYWHPDRPPQVAVISPEALKGELTEASDAMGAFSAEFDEEALNGVFDGAAESKTLDELGVLVNQENRDPRQTPDEPFTYIDLSSVDRGVITVADQVMGADAPSRARRIVLEGDIVFATVRPNLRGHAVVPSELDGAIASTGFAVLRVPTGINPNYLLVALFAPSVVQQCMEAMKGAHYPALKVEHVKGLRVRVPDSSNVQEQIVEAVWPKLMRVRAARLALTSQCTDLLDSLKDAEFALLDGGIFEL
jgi:type I restriction enzyme M protein